MGIGNGVAAKKYKTLLMQAQALTQRKWRAEGGYSLPNINIRFGDHRQGKLGFEAHRANGLRCLKISS
ncbi:hypothetical protein BTN33_21565 [Aeromonas veronii]|nr:hypothetical protein BTN33_21565 [Aeromonas veronii]